MTLLLLQRLGFKKRSRVEGRIETSAKPLVERARSREQSLLEQAGPRRDIARHLGLALVDRAHRMRDLEAGVPQRADEADDAAGGASASVAATSPFTRAARAAEAGRRWKASGLRNPFPLRAPCAPTAPRDCGRR